MEASLYQVFLLLFIIFIFISLKRKKENNHRPTKKIKYEVSSAVSNSSEKTCTTGATFTQDPNLSPQISPKLKDYIWVKCEKPKIQNLNDLLILRSPRWIDSASKQITSIPCTIYETETYPDLVSNPTANNSVLNETANPRTIDEKHKVDNSSVTYVTYENGRAYPKKELLEMLNNYAVDIFSISDDIKFTHKCRGEGSIVRIKEHRGEKAVLEVSYKDSIKKEVIDILSSSDILSLSMKAKSIKRYINLFNKLSAENKISKFQVSEKIGRSYSIKPPPQSWDHFVDDRRDDFEFYDDSSVRNEESGPDSIDSSWHDYHKHD